jgi:hypothetical protein
MISGLARFRFLDVFLNITVVILAEEIIHKLIMIFLDDIKLLIVARDLIVKRIR